MTNDSGHETTPQEAQRNGQSGVSQDNPLRELSQDGEARGKATEPASASPGLTDDEISVLCDIEKDGLTTPHKQPVVKSLIERGFVVSHEPLERFELTSLAQQRLGKRGVGLSES